LGANGQLVTFNQGYIMLSSDLSGKTNEAKARMDTSAGVKEQAEMRRDALSGVSLEQESLNLSNYQVAYQASAQVLQAARAIFDTIISLSRG
jgi:flagellar hook-associated protein 1